MELRCFSVAVSALSRRVFNWYHSRCALRWRGGGAMIAKVVIGICRPRNPTGDQRRCPVIIDVWVNDLAAPTALNSMSHFRHMQFLSLSSWRYTRHENALSTFCIVTPRISARVCLSVPRIDFKSFNALILYFSWGFWTKISLNFSIRKEVKQ